MPTGYTAAIGEGCAFEQFVLLCSRAMCATIMQRDDPLEAKVVMDTPSDFYRQALDEARQALVRFATLTTAQIQTEYEAELADKKRQEREHAAKDSELLKKYEAVLARVDAWEPPTAEHQGLKEFMQQQIRDSIRFDCGSEYYSGCVARMAAIGARDWHRERVQNAMKSVERSAGEQAAEEERCRSRNEWKTQLVTSLGLSVKQESGDVRGHDAG